jgi:hypothetical protein
MDKITNIFSILTQLDEDYFTKQQRVLSINAMSYENASLKKTMGNDYQLHITYLKVLCDLIGI